MGNVQQSVHPPITAGGKTTPLSIITDVSTSKQAQSQFVVQLIRVRIVADRCAPEVNGRLVSSRREFVRPSRSRFGRLDVFRPVDVMSVVMFTKDCGSA